MLKIIGIMLIMGSITIFGEKCVDLMKRRIKSLESLVKLIDAIESKIAAFNMPMDRVFLSYSDKHLEDTGFSEILRTVGLGEAVVSSKVELCLDDSETSLLVELSEDIGQYTSAEQIKRCKYYRTELEKILKQAKEKMPVNARLFRSSGVMCGILAAVALI